MNLELIKNNKYIIPVIFFAALLFFATAPLHARPYTVILLTTVFMFIALTVSWTIFSGPTGYMSLATAAFFGVGIYVSVILGGHLPIYLLVLCGGLFSSVLAMLVGAVTLRLRGIYFAIFTFGLVEFIRHLTTWIEINIVGTRGHFVVRTDNVTAYYIILTILAAVLITAFFIRHSKFGLALASIGSCEEAAAHVGVNVVLLKVFTFALSAFFIGMTGSIMATRWGYIDPNISFNAFYSFLPVLMAIFGGMGNLFGPIIGASAFAYLQEYLITEFPYFYMLIFGTIMVITILYLPTGLVGLLQNIIRWIRRWKRSGGNHAHTSS